MAMSFDDAKNLASQGYSAFGAAGRYGEGGVQQAADALKSLKAGVQAGKLSIIDYQNLAQPLVPEINKSINSLVSQKQGALATSISEDLRSAGILKADSTGKNVFAIPFTTQEYAKLPANVLPTQDQVNQGLISATDLPMQKFQNPTGGGTDASGNGIPSYINTTTDQGQAELLAQRQGADLQTTLDQQNKVRADARTALASQMADYQNQQFGRAIPQLAEQANTQGILQSTGFGDLLANKYSQLTQDTNNQLAQQAESDAQQYAGGLGDIANVKTGLQTSGLQRNLSLEDQNSTSSLAQTLAKLSQPQSTGPSSKAQTNTALASAGLQGLGAGAGALAKL